MTKIIWIILLLFVVGNAFFVLPVHLSKEVLTTDYSANYKKDSDLLRAVFPDSAIHLQVNMPVEYEKLYLQTNTVDFRKGKQAYILVNVSISNNLDFASLLFPFYKVASYNSIIAFYSIIKVANAPERDSTVLIGNISVKGKLSVAGISTPLYVRTLVEKELVNVFKKEMSLVEQDINRRPVADTTVSTVIEPIPVQKHSIKSKKNNRFR